MQGANKQTRDDLGPVLQVGIAKLDRMEIALSECYRVDEVKDIKDKAKALEVYAAQAGNTEAERRACAIRLRAERRVGELLAGMERDTPTKAIQKRWDTAAGAAGVSEYALALESAGIDERTARRYQQLAEVPRAQFEAALAAPDKPTVRGIIGESEKKLRSMNNDALWLWGRLRDFERMELWKWVPSDIIEEMTDTMAADCARIAPILAEWLKSFEDIRK